MNVKLIAVSQPVDKAIVNAEQLIVYCARVSSPDNQTNMLTAAKLLAYCLKHRHYSIFETASMTVEIKTSVAIAAQVLRHRSFTFQQFSARYSKVQNFTTTKARRQDVKNKQNSIDDLPDVTLEWFNRAQRNMHKHAIAAYNSALSLGIAKEQARFLLPQSAETTLYMTGSVRSWMHYLESRCDVSTQKEHRDVANRIKEIFIEQFPLTAEALSWAALTGGESDQT